MQCLCHCSSYLRKTTNTPTLYGGEGGGLCILLSSEMTLFEYQVSTILSPIVDSVSSCFLVLCTDPIAKWSISKRIQTTLDNTHTGFTQSSKVLEFYGMSLKSPRIFFSFECSGLERVFFMLFGCPRWNINHSSENSKVIHKVLHVLCNN